jgi:hypothetical protein
MSLCGRDRLDGALKWARDRRSADTLIRMPNLLNLTPDTFDRTGAGGTIFLANDALPVLNKMILIYAVKPGVAPIDVFADHGTTRVPGHADMLRFDDGAAMRRTREHFFVGGTPATLALYDDQVFTAYADPTLVARFTADLAVLRARSPSAIAEFTDMIASHDPSFAPLRFVTDTFRDRLQSLDCSIRTKGDVLNIRIDASSPTFKPWVVPVGHQRPALPPGCFCRVDISHPFVTASRKRVGAGLAEWVYHSVQRTHGTLDASQRERVNKNLAMTITAFLGDATTLAAERMPDGEIVTYMVMQFPEGNNLDAELESARKWFAGESKLAEGVPWARTTYRDESRDVVRLTLAAKPGSPVGYIDFVQSGNVVTLTSTQTPVRRVAPLAALKPLGPMTSPANGWVDLPRLREFLDHSPPGLSLAGLSFDPEFLKSGRVTFDAKLDDGILHLDLDLPPTFLGPLLEALHF